MYGVAFSGALHGGLFLIASFGSCLAAVTPSLSAASASTVSFDVAEPAPIAPSPPPSKLSSPGGGAPVRRPGHSRRPVELAELPPRMESGPRAAPAAPPADLPVAETVSDQGVEVAAAAPSDDAVPQAPVARTPDAGTVSAVSSASPATAGRGPGTYGGPGGFGRRARPATLPEVNRKFGLGGETGDFKAVVCFIQPGTVRIADVHGCEPVAVFYTDTFNIPERQFYDGFPGVTTRSTWFMIEYRGSFTVSRSGIHHFRLHSDDGSYLFIDDALVIENDGKHEPMSQSGSVHLRAGRHQLRLLYAQTVDRMALQLFVRRPGDGGETLFKSEL